MIRLLRVLIPAGSLTLFISEVLILAGAFVLGTYIALVVDPITDVTPYSYLVDTGKVSILLVLASLIIGFYLQDLYTDIYVKSRIILIQQLCLVVGIAFLVQGFISYVDEDLRMPLRVMAAGSLLATGASFCWRILFSKVLVLVVGRDRLLFVGDSPVLLDIGRYIAEHPEKGVIIAGYVGELHEPGEQLPGGKLLGPISTLREIVEATRPTNIVVGMYERRNRLPMNELLDLRFAGHLFEEAATAYERVCGRVCVKELRPSHLIYTGELGPRHQTVIYQRLVNMVMAVIGLIVFLPFMLLVAIAVRLSSPGPILYRQVRVGMNEEPFTLYKFRSMRADAEAATGAVFASKDDPRVTAVGRIIRKIRFDELPQFFNVLKGEMSVVGPRPERPEFVHELSVQIPYYRQRHCVRPGITGWAQISFKYGDSVEDTVSKLEYDLFYIKNMSFSLDTYIILHTLKTMLLTRGAQ